MAVFTELSDGDRDEIAASYGLSPLSSVIGIADGDVETTYLFFAQGKEFIVTLFESGVTASDLERAFDTMELLSRNGIPCPQPLRSLDGKASTRVSNKLVAVVSFVPGAPSTSAGPEKCRDLGRRVAEIHLLLRRLANRAPTVLPRGPVHGALSPDNVFFLNDRVSGIINFRLGHDDVLVAELAEVLVRWSMDGSGWIDKSQALAIISGYSSIRQLDDQEQKALPAFVLAAAAKALSLHGSREQLLTWVGRAFQSSHDLFPQ